MAHDEAEMERHLRAIRDDADLRQSLVAKRPGDDPRPAQLRASRRRAFRHRSTTRSRESRWRCPHEDRVLRLKPAVVVLERRRHLLSRRAERPRPARLRHHVLRARRLRPPETPGHRPAVLGRRARLSGHRGRRARGRRRSGAGRRRRQGERRRRLRRRAARWRDRRLAPGGHPHLLGRGRAGDARRPAPGPGSCPTPGHALARSRADLWRRAARHRGLRELWGTALRADLQRARSRRRIIPYRPRSASRPISPSSATGCPTARPGSRSSSCARPRELPAGAF